MKKICFSIVIVLLMNLFFPELIFGQTGKDKESKKNNIGWIELGIGVGKYSDSEKAGAGLLALNFKLKRNYFAIRFSGVSESIFGGIADYGLLFGVPLTKGTGKLFSSLGVGISLVELSGTQFGLFGGRSGSVSSYQGVGIPLQAVFSFHPSMVGIGVGATLFGNINTKYPFVGIAVSIQFGRFRL